MDSAAHKLIESATHRTLHAHSFARSSSQASIVLTDLLSRYLALLSSTCAKYAQHAGRTRMTARDALGALDELGVSLEELSEYCSTEGKDLGRYAIYSARRVEDLNEFKSQLADGLKQDHDDVIPLHYARYRGPPLHNEEDEDEEEEEEFNEWEHADDEVERDTQDMEVDTDMPPPRRTSPLSRRRRPTPPLPLSPISNPSSPSRKRPRTSNWHPPDHIPDFLPPFPTTTDAPPSPISPHSPRPSQMEPPPLHLEDVKIEKPPLALSQPMTSTSADYLTQVPYSQSSLSSIPEWHLPSNIPPQILPARSSRLPTPQTEPALLAAYHHILTHPPPPNPASANPARHKVAMALLSQTQNTPRWDPPDTLYSSIAPCPPRVAPIGPTYPVAIAEPPPFDSKSKADGKEKDVKFPPAIPRPVSTIERLTPLISQQPSRIPDLARHVLPPAILTRTSRLTHPPVLHRGSKPLTYGPGIPAPWNANLLPPSDGIPQTPLGTTSKAKDPPLPNGATNGKGKDVPVKPAIPDARLFATWDYDPKDFRVPLPSSARNRARMGSVVLGGGGGGAGGSGVISLALGARGRSGSKHG